MNQNSYKRPDFIIVGAMKCATSTLHDQLALQPGIHMSDPKEPNFFSNDEEYSKGLEWYSSLFDSQSGIINGESSTHYTKFPTYPNTIQRMLKAGLSEVKLIYVIRHPVDRLVSQFIHEWTEGIISCSIDEAITKHPELIQYSKYMFQLKHFLSHFPKEQILVVFYEKLISDSQAELEKVASFIGYDGAVSWSDEQKASNISAQRIRKFPLYSFLIDSPPMAFLRRKLIPKSLRNRVKSGLRMQERPVLSESALDYLSKELEQDMSELGGFLGLNLTFNNYYEVARK